MIDKYLKVLKEIGIDEVFMETANHESMDKVKLLEELGKEIQECKKCDLYKHRKQAVLGEGNPNAKLMFVGEAPGADEDRLGRPFVGRAGQLLTKLIEATGHKREEFYITNVNKCRPPGNRTPTPWEQEACFPFLERQIEIINPKILCLLGAAAARAFLKRPVSITKERGEVLNWNGKKLILTLHPAYILRNPSAEELLFEDIKKAIDLALSD